MRISFISVLLAITLLPACAQHPETITTFILIRHAEKASDGTDDPDLKPEGVLRANKLVDMFSDTPIAAIYSTNFKRTKNSVRPLAQAKEILIEEYEAFQADPIDAMLARHAGETILICGHSNNIPWIANLLIGTEQYSDFQDTEYNTMLIVSVVHIGKLATSVQLKY
ncbi:MAG: histidine phosphatase family protein [Cyclobacteriaceae bacterium]|nr:histidine phosphatase family protein [Cyclobacteriaceae bacterium]